MRFQVETYISGRPYKIAQFDNFEAAKAYQQELHGIGHYYVPVIDRDTADRAEYGTRLDMSIEDQNRLIWSF